MSKNRFKYCQLDPHTLPKSVKGIIDLNSCINAFSDLPNRVLIDLQFIAGSNEEQELLEGIKEIYYWTGYWLRYFLLNQTQIKSQLISTDGKHFKSHAELSVALYQLCEEAYSYPGWAKEFFDSPAELWLTCEYEKCLLGLENSGLIGIPLSISKREYTANMNKFWGKQGRGNTEESAGSLRDPDKREIYLNYKLGTPIKLVSPFYMLILTASYLANVDIKFREGVYKSWIKADKRHARTILNNKNLGGVYLTTSGDLIDTQSTANLPGSRLEKRRKKSSEK